MTVLFLCPPSSSLVRPVRARVLSSAARIEEAQAAVSKVEAEKTELAAASETDKTELTKQLEEAKALALAAEDKTKDLEAEVLALKESRPSAEAPRLHREARRRVTPPFAGAPPVVVPNFPTSGTSPDCDASETK